LIDIFEAIVSLPYTSDERALAKRVLVRLQALFNTPRVYIGYNLFLAKTCQWISKLCGNGSLSVLTRSGMFVVLCSTKVGLAAT
jgi:hypothetical protein